MSPELFWTHRTALEAAGLEVGFGTFSAAHFLWIAVMAAGIAANAVAYRCGDSRRRDTIRKALAFFIILFEIFKQCVMALTGVPVADFLPLELCSFGEYALLADAMWPDGRFLRQPLLYLFLPAAIMALALPTVAVYPAINFYTIHQFVLHAVIAAYVIARYSAGELRPTYAGIWTSVAKLLPLVAAVYWIDVSFGKSFMFLTDPYGNPIFDLLWGLAGGRGGLAYVGLLIVFIVIVLHVVYAIFRLIGMLTARCGKTPASAGQ